MSCSKYSKSVGWVYPEKYILLFVFCILFSEGWSQQSWRFDSTTTYIGIEWLKPFFDSDDGISFFTSAPTINGKFKLGGKSFLVAELPFAYLNGDFSDGEFGIGNPYLGVELNQGAKHFFDMGVHIPIASEEEALLVGVLGDYDRAEAYISDLFSFHARYNYLARSSSSVFFRMRGGPSIWVPTEDGGDTEVIFDYLAQMGFDGTKVQILGGFSGRLILTEDGDFGERTIHHFAAAANFKTGNVEPGLLLRVPLDDDLSEILDVVLGLQVRFRLNK